MARPTTLTVTIFLFSGSLLAAKSPGKSARQNGDQIEVIGHLACNGAGVTALIAGEHWRKNYLYLNGAGKITIVDVTNGSAPKIEGEYQNSLPASQVQLVVGNAALLAEGQGADPSVPRSMSIMSFADPLKPKVVRQFTNISAFLMDRRRGLIYIVNNEGLWILNEKPARDLEAEKQYDRELMYNH